MSMMWYPKIRRGFSFGSFVGKGFHALMCRVGPRSFGFCSDVEIGSSSTQNWTTTAPITLLQN